jgi:hypothetical protein
MWFCPGDFPETVLLLRSRFLLGREAGRGWLHGTGVRPLGGGRPVWSGVWARRTTSSRRVRDARCDSGQYGVGRIRARYLMARFPNPPVRPVRETFASYGSRERDITGDVHFASSTEHSPWTALRVRWVPLYSFPTLPLRAFAMCAAFLRSDYYAPFDCL